MFVRDLGSQEKYYDLTESEIDADSIQDYAIFLCIF